MAKLSKDDNLKDSFQTSFNTPIHYSQVIGTSNSKVANPDATVSVNDGKGTSNNRLSITIKAHPNNSGTIFVGHTNAVTVAENSGTGGYPLAAGESIGMDLAETSGTLLRDIYAISDAAGQEIRVLEK